jgi:hypothetical protein
MFKSMNTPEEATPPEGEPERRGLPWNSQKCEKKLRGANELRI